MSFQPDIQYRSVPLGCEGATAPTFLPGKWQKIVTDVGNIQLASGNYLVVDKNSSYGEGAIGSVFTVDRDSGANLLKVTTTENVQFKIPYLGV